MKCLFGLLILASSLVLTREARAQLIVAHRGASQDAPENTLAAFKLAWDQNCDGIEGDFYLTADNEIVCIHDNDTKRTTGVDCAVEKSTLSRLRELDAGRWKGATWSGERIPTFEEVFRTVPAGRLFVIELKSKSAIVPVLASELRRLDASKIRILIISFDADTVRACKKHLPTIPVHWLTSFKQATPGSPYLPTAEQIAQTVRSCGADGVGMKGVREVITKNFVDRLKAEGCQDYHVWTIDSPDDARYFSDLGVVGITTNLPAEIGSAVRRSSDR